MNLSRWCVLVCMLMAVPGFAQEARNVGPVLPDSPSAVAVEKKQPAREILADDPYHPLSHREKLHHWLARTYSPYTFANAAVNTIYTGALGQFRYCCGADAWGKQYGAAIADTEARMFFGDYLFPTLLNQDPRYFPKRKGNFVARGWYAATRVLVTRNDDGKNQFNWSEMLAVAFTAALSNAYYTDGDRTWAKNGARIYGTYQSDAAGNVLREFTPDLKRIFNAIAPKRVRKLADKWPVESSQ